MDDFTKNPRFFLTRLARFGPECTRMYPECTPNVPRMYPDVPWVYVRFAPICQRPRGSFRGVMRGSHDDVSMTILGSLPTHALTALRIPVHVPVVAVVAVAAGVVVAVFAVAAVISVVPAACVQLPRGTPV